MRAQAVACTLDLDDDRVVQQAVEKRGGDHGIAEDVAPFGEPAVRREYHRALFVAVVDELEEEVCAARGDGQIADLVDDQQTVAAEEAELFTQATIPFGPAERLDDLGEGGAVDPLSGSDSLDAEGGCEMILYR